MFTRTIGRCILAVAALAGLPAMTPDASALSVATAIDGLNGPVRLTSPPADSRLFVVEQRGVIKVYTAGGESLGTFLDVTDLTNRSGERGLLGLAFAPDYASTGRFYIHYTNLSGDTRVARYLVDPDNPDRALASSASPVLSVDQPYSNHNGGHLAFGPDGMLYIGLGDGGGGGDPQNFAQNDQSLLGKMLRLDVSGAAGYTIPADNPFVDLSPRNEIWAKGLRNPWVYSFDRQTGDLWIADVGQNLLEEIDVQPAGSGGGENYGWRLMEGTDCYNPPADCNDGSLTLPVHEYSHNDPPFPCSISGGHVYRGGQVPELYGRYLFADYCSDQIWALTWTETGGLGEVTELTASLTPTGGFGNIVGINEDAAGELYVIDISAGVIYRITGDTTAVTELPPLVQLEQNAPNPFNPGTTIAYTVPAGGGEVHLEIRDVAGRLVRVLVDGVRPQGRQAAYWDGTAADGRIVAAGVYLYRLRAEGVDETRKAVMLK